MIITQITDSLPTAVTDKIAGKLKPVSVSKPVAPTENDICICGCSYTEKVFSEVGAIVTSWKNDKTSLLFKKVITTDTITIKLFKDSVETATISDDTYGTYYSTFANQPLYVGFIACWNKIYNSLGSGQYQFKIYKTIIGNEESPVETIYYQLYPYTDLKANGTVRIESYNTGTILSSDFDYYDLITGGWYQSYRIKGKLLPKDPKFEADNYLDADYKRLQIQDKITNEWTLETGLLPAEVSNQIIYDNLLSNKIIISDYNYYNEEQIREKELYFSEIVDKKSFPKQKNCTFELKFTDKIENIIKNNF